MSRGRFWGEFEVDASTWVFLEVRTVGRNLGVTKVPSGVGWSLCIEIS